MVQLVEIPDLNGVVVVREEGGRSNENNVIRKEKKKKKKRTAAAAAAAASASASASASAAEIEEENGAEVKKSDAVVPNIDVGFLHQEPLSLFGSDIMLMILDLLDAKGIALCLVVSRGWHQVASSDSLWTSRCQELWLGKAHIPLVSQVRRISRLAAYSFSVMDGRRTRIVKEDLCDHAWQFRFKQEAPEYWLNLDPSWTGIGPPMKRYFHPDGTLSADPGDLVWGAHECTYSIVTSFVGDGKIREHYVRINRWPHMNISRNLDWSWELDNCLNLYSSIPDADKEGGTGPLFPVF